MISHIWQPSLHEPVLFDIYRCLIALRRQASSALASVIAVYIVMGCSSAPYIGFFFFTTFDSLSGGVMGIAQLHGYDDGTIFIALRAKLCCRIIVLIRIGAEIIKTLWHSQTERSCLTSGGRD